MSKNNPKDKYVDFLDFTKGLYEKALQFLAPGSDDFSIFSGAILLTVGLEKFVKYVLYKKHPFMILYKKIDGFEDIIKLEEGDDFSNCNTISFEKALERLVRLYPALSSEAKDIEYIIRKRNFLVHNFGHIKIGSLEKKIQTKIADMSEAICKECLNKDPKEVFTESVWSQISKIREAYKNADILEIKQRIKYLKRLYSQGESLPCEEVEIPKFSPTVEYNCPICEDEATIAIESDIDVDFDHRDGTIFGAYKFYYPTLMKCSCGFTMSDTEEIEIIMGDDYETLMEYFYSQDQPEQEYYREDK